MGFWPYIIGFIYFPLFVSYIAILQRKRLTRKNLRKTFEEAKADYKLHPWIYYFAYLLTFPFGLLSIMIWTKSEHEIINYLSILFVILMFFVFKKLMLAVHGKIMFPKPSEPTTKLLTQEVGRKRTLSFHNIIVKRHSQIFCPIYQVTDENGDIYYIAGEIENEIVNLDYNIVVSIGQNTGRLYFEKIRKSGL